MIQHPPTSFLDRSARPGGETLSPAPTDPAPDAPGPPSGPRKAPLGYLAIAAVAVCATVFALDALRARLWHRQPRAAVAAPQHRAALARQKQEIWRTKIAPQLDAADRRTARGIEDGVQAVQSFLKESQKGTRAFAEAMLSLRSKWALVKSKAPGFAGGDDQAHIRFLNEKFSELVFSDDEFRKAIEAAVTAYLGSVQAAENELLVAVRADMADIPLEALPAARSEQLFRNEFENLTRQISPAVARELGVDVVREMSSLIASEIATTVLTNLATRLGVSSGLLAAGVSASWTTFGLSIVAAIVVDQVVCWVVSEVRDPAGELEGRMNRLLADIGRLIIEGDGYSPGLRAQLNAFDRSRSYVRRIALERLILGQDAPSAASRPQDDQGNSLQHFNTKGR